MKVLTFEDYSSISHFENVDGRTVALYYVMFTIFMLFLCYKHQEKSCIHGGDVRSLCIYPYAKLLALLPATIFLTRFGGLAFYEVSESSFAEALWLACTFIVDRVSTMQRVVCLHKFMRHVEICNDGRACFLSCLKKGGFTTYGE